MDRAWRFLSYARGLLVGLHNRVAGAVDHVRQLSVEGGVRPPVVIEFDPGPQPRAGFRSGLVGMQVDALAFLTAPEPLDEDVFQEASLAVHRDANARAPQRIGPGKGRELAALVRVHDFWWPEARDDFLQRIGVELRLRRVREPRGQYPAAVPVHDRDQIEKAASHREIRDVGAVRSFDLGSKISLEPCHVANVGVQPEDESGRAGAGAASSMGRATVGLIVLRGRGGRALSLTGQAGKPAPAPGGDRGRSGNVSDVQEGHAGLLVAGHKRSRTSVAVNSGSGTANPLSCNAAGRLVRTHMV